jgi:hypothetical protein
VGGICGQRVSVAMGEGLDWSGELVIASCVLLQADEVGYWR